MIKLLFSFIILLLVSPSFAFNEDIITRGMSIKSSNAIAIIHQEYDNKEGTLPVDGMLNLFFILFLDEDLKNVVVAQFTHNSWRIENNYKICNQINMIISDDGLIFTRSVIVFDIDNLEVNRFSMEIPDEELSVISSFMADELKMLIIHYLKCRSMKTI